MKKTNTTAILIFSIITAILSVFLFIFLLKVIENKNQKVATILTTLEEKRIEKENAKIFSEKIAEIKLLQNSINNHFVNTNNIDTFASFLEKVGSDLGGELSIKNIEIPPETQNIINFEVSIKGTFPEVMEIITSLENIAYQIDVTQVYLNKDIQPEEMTGVKQLKPIIKIPVWQADVSFNILSSN